MFQESLKSAFVLFAILVGLTACVSGNDDLGLASVSSKSEVNPSAPENSFTSPQTVPNYSFATEQNQTQTLVRPRVQKTYLINGLASSVESIGYGFTNLSKKIRGSELHNYASFIESSTLIRSQVTRDIRAQYARNPNVEINMIGISFGANIVTLIANDLHRHKVPVNYLVTMEGPAMVPIKDNVRKADHFRCTNLDCFRTKAKLAHNNKRTKFAIYDIKTSHIPLADHRDVHAHILRQIRAPIY